MQRLVFEYINKWQIMMEPQRAEAVGHLVSFGFQINTALDYKGEGAQGKLQFSHSRQHDLHHHVSVEDSSHF